MNKLELIVTVPSSRYPESSFAGPFRTALIRSITALEADSNRAGWFRRPAIRRFALAPVATTGANPADRVAPLPQSGTKWPEGCCHGVFFWISPIHPVVAGLAHAGWFSRLGIPTPSRQGARSVRHFPWCRRRIPRMRPPYHLALRLVWRFKGNTCAEHRDNLGLDRLNHVGDHQFSCL